MYSTYIETTKREIHMLDLKYTKGSRREITNGKIALIDMDIICYQAAFAAKNDSVDKLHHTIDEMVADITYYAGCEDYKGYITGKGNFRIKVAVTRPYKGTRKSEKPHHYEEARRYLKDAHNAYEVIGWEADDYLSIALTIRGEQAVLCTIDKDLRNTPGAHWNWRKKIKDVVTPKMATKTFLLQMLTGDSCDNIPGVPRVGPVKANKLLDGLTRSEMVRTIGIQYAIAYDNPEEVMTEMGLLLWMSRQPGVNFDLNRLINSGDATYDETTGE